VIRVVLVDDHEVVRAGLAALLSTAADIEIVATAADGQEAIAAVAEFAPDVVLMDLSMPVLDGVAATTAVTRDHPAVRILVLTSFAERDRVRAAIAAGASGYLLKDCTPTELLTAIRQAAAGQHPLDPRVTGALLPMRDRTVTDGPPTGDSDAASTADARAVVGLSDREVEVLRLVSTGLANKQVGRQLGISERTVKVHLGNVFRRIGVNDRTSAALWARDHLN
jgi:DNA-binding NarL/FixJ family response regulator